MLTQITNISANDIMFDSIREFESMFVGERVKIEAFAIKNVEIGWDINLGNYIRVKEHLMGGGKEGMCTPMVDTKTGHVDMA